MRPGTSQPSPITVHIAHCELAAAPLFVHGARCGARSPPSPVHGGRCELAARSVPARSRRCELAARSVPARSRRCELSSAPFPVHGGHCELAARSAHSAPTLLRVSRTLLARSTPVAASGDRAPRPMRAGGCRCRACPTKDRWPSLRQPAAQDRYVIYLLRDFTYRRSRELRGASHGSSWGPCRTCPRHGGVWYGEGRTAEWRSRAGSEQS
jgi:hypothetical protein